MKNTRMSRRQLLELGAAATLGAMVNTIDQQSISAATDSPGDTAGVSSGPARLSGLAAEYDKYDGLGLAALVAKRQVTPAELLSAVRQRLEAANPKLNATAQVFFE